jgi:hypothetical protein
MWYFLQKKEKKMKTIKELKNYIDNYIDNYMDNYMDKLIEIKNFKKPAEKKTQTNSTTQKPAMISCDFTLMLFKEAKRPLQIQNLKDLYADKGLKVNEHRLADHIKELENNELIIQVNPGFKRSRLYRYTE